MKRLTIRRLPIVLAIAIGTGVVCCMVFFINIFDSMQLYSGDVLFKTSYTTLTTGINDKIVIVAIDDNSLSELGKLSLWPRSYYARLVDILDKSKARLIVFDILFSETSPDDARFAASMKAAGNVVIPVAAKTAAVNSIIVDGTRSTDIFLRPVPALTESAIALGHADVLAGQDGTVRDLALFMNDGNEDVPALSLATVAKYLRRPSAVEHSGNGGIFSIAGRSIPVTNGSDMIINYIPSSNEKMATIFQTVSFVDVLKGNVDACLFKDKIAIIGSTASGLGDAFWTPLGTKLNGVEIHASAVNTILSGNFVKSAPPATTVACIFILCFLCGLIVVYFQPLLAALLSFSLGLAYILVVSACFERGLMLNPFYPSLSILSSFISMSLYNVMWERSQRNALEKTFGRYVSPAVSDRILKVLDRDELKLDGEEQEITVVFADIRGFSKIAHLVDTRELVTVLNRYLAILIKAVVKYHGVVNKFNGDGIMAIWNAPTTCAQHPLMAVKAALEAQNGIGELQQREPSLLKVDFGIGVCTGMAVCGNLGCEDRLEYSAIGTTVNSASRITGLAPGGTVVISDDTFKLVRDYVETRSLGKVMIKGDSDLSRLYEVIRVNAEVDNTSEIIDRNCFTKFELSSAFKRFSEKKNLVFDITSNKSRVMGGVKTWQ